MFVRSPTPAKVSRNAHRERFARSVICPALNTPAVASADTTRNPSTNFGNFAQRNADLLDRMPPPRPPRDHASAYASTTKPIVALRVVLASTANRPAVSENNAPAAVASAVLSTARPTHSPYAW